MPRSATATTLDQKILALADEPGLETRLALVNVLGAVGKGDASVVRTLTTLLGDERVLVRRAVLDALQACDARGLAQVLVPLLGSDDDAVREQVRTLLVSQGAPAAEVLGRAVMAGTPALRRQAATLLATSFTARAIDALLSQVAEPAGLGEHVLGLIRVQVIDATGDEAQALREQLAAAIGKELGPRVAPAKAKTSGRRNPPVPTAEEAQREARVIALLRLVGYLADGKRLPLLLAYAQPGRSTYVRTAAIAGMRRLVAHGHGKGHDQAVLDLIDWAHDDDAQVSRAAVDTLRGAQLPTEAQKPFAALARGRNAEARRLVAERLTSMDSGVAIPALLRQLGEGDQGLRDVAGRALAQNADAGLPLARALAASTTADETARRLAAALRGHADKLPARGLEALTAAAQQAQKKVPDLAALLAELLTVLAPEAAAQQVFTAAAVQRKRGEHEAALATLRPVMQSRATLGDEQRAAIVGIGLLAHGQRLLRAAWSVDPVLGQAATLARQGAPLAKLLGKQKDLGPDELFVLGFNFVETKDDDLREAGRELLELVMSRQPRGKLGVAARNKLRLVGE